VRKINDSKKLKKVRKDMKVIELKEKEKDEIFEIVESVLKMGNVGLKEEEGKEKVIKNECVEDI
jgi:myosin heavy subunit